MNKKKLDYDRHYHEIIHCFDKNLFFSEFIKPEQKIKFEKLIIEYFEQYHLYSIKNTSRLERSNISGYISNYCQFVKKGRWKEIEHFIIHDKIFAHDYIKFVVKGRLVEYETQILNNTNSPRRLWSYAVKINQKLPEEFHNKMLAYSLGGNGYSIKYLNTFCKK